jgi:translation initiation factor 3 subunit F
MASAAPRPAVKVHATAIMAILGAYARRDDRNARIMGTLLGVRREGNIEVRTERIRVHSCINSTYQDMDYTAICSSFLSRTVVLT